MQSHASCIGLTATTLMLTSTFGRFLRCLRTSESTASGLPSSSMTSRTLVASPDTAALRTSLLNLLSHLRTGLGSILIFAGGFNTRLSASFLITALWNSLP